MAALLWCYCFSLLLTFYTVLPQESKSASVCTKQTSCGACIAAAPECGWCMQLDYDAVHRERCDKLSNLIYNGCDDTYVVQPGHEVEFTRNDPPKNADGQEDAIQLTPQAVEVLLRPNKPFKFDVTFRQAENYPVDLYFVMDLSYSMLDDKAKLAELGDALTERMSAITENFRLGFGSFIDKKTMPYVNIQAAKLETPCTGCASPYGFRNEMSLTENTALFQSQVNATAISGNLDAPEGGFDAIIQAVACTDAIQWRTHSRKLLLYSSDAGFHYAGDGKEEVGWRAASRKMLLFSTDAGFHYAGDGKLGGIVTPNDGACHLDTNGEYSESLNQDYPSISQIKHKVAEKKVNVIFAITKEQLPVYDKLSGFIEGSVAGELADDSSNIVELVKENYEKISSTVELKTENADGIYVTFRTKCGGTEFRDVAHCDGIGIGQNVTFEVEVQVTECPADPAEREKIFKIYPVGLTEQLEVKLSLLCECDCEQPEFQAMGDVQPPEDYSPACNGSGTFQCGACSCPTDRYGRKCECDRSTLNSDDFDLSCKKTNDSDVCDGHGQCVCGTCECGPISPSDPGKLYRGPFCECNDYSCDFFEGKLCGGDKRGDCDCGKCYCKPGFTKSACECPISEETCRAKTGDKLICNGKGECLCGVCDCSLDNYYRGPTCEDCPSCPGQCAANKACVQCWMFNSGEYTEEYCAANCSHIVKVDRVQDLNDRRLCKFRDDDDCDFYFTYEYDTQKVEAQRTKECPQPVNVLAIVLGVIGGIIAIGLALLLIWKLLVTIHDRREFAKFEKERQNAKWDMGENPIYKQATSTFKNPTYNK